MLSPCGPRSPCSRVASSRDLPGGSSAAPVAFARPSTAVPIDEAVAAECAGGEDEEGW